MTLALHFCFILVAFQFRYYDAHAVVDVREKALHLPLVGYVCRFNGDAIPNMLRSFKGVLGSPRFRGPFQNG